MTLTSMTTLMTLMTDDFDNSDDFDDLLKIEIIIIRTIMNGSDVMIDIITPSITFSNSGDIPNMNQSVCNAL